MISSNRHFFLEMRLWLRGCVPRSLIAGRILTHCKTLLEYGPGIGCSVLLVILYLNVTPQTLRRSLSEHFQILILGDPLLQDTAFSKFLLRRHWLRFIHNIQTTQVNATKLKG
jgi:hypothetical protein